MFSIIVAFDKNFCIGKDGKMPWHIKEDFQWFKEKTYNHTVVMGKKTFLSIGRILPNRKTIIISHTPFIEAENCHTVQNFEEYLEENKDSDEEIFICGGGEIYKKALPYAKKLYLTIVDTEIENGDTFFPKLNLNKNKIEYQSVINSTPACKFIIYDRTKNFERQNKINKSKEK